MEVFTLESYTFSAPSFPTLRFGGQERLPLEYPAYRQNAQNMIFEPSPILAPVQHSGHSDSKQESEYDTSRVPHLLSLGLLTTMLTASLRPKSLSSLQISRPVATNMSPKSRGHAGFTGKHFVRRRCCAGREF